MTECEMLLAEAIAKKDASHTREAQHSVAAALLSEAVVHVLEMVTPLLGPKLSLPQARRLLKGTVSSLMRAHEQSMLAQDGKDISPRGFRATTPYVWHLIEDDRYEDRGTSQERSGRV